MTQPLPTGKAEIKQAATLLYEGNKSRPGDLAQSLMDLGATICTPKSPKCGICPLQAYCKGFQQGIAETLPRKDPKKEKPQKYGHYYWITNGKGAVLFERRPETQMLGGMLGLPTSTWVRHNQDIVMPYSFENIKEMGRQYRVRHSFTHFDLELDGYAGLSDGEYENMVWIEPQDLKKAGLPSLFKKAVKLMI